MALEQLLAVNRVMLGDGSSVSVQLDFAQDIANSTIKGTLSGVRDASSSVGTVLNAVRSGTKSYLHPRYRARQRIGLHALCGTGLLTER
jgi:hypothetical protein